MRNAGGTGDVPAGLVQIAATFNQGDVAIIKSLLQSEGISCITLGEAFNWARPFVVPVRFLVREDQAGEAAELLRDLDLAYYTLTFRQASLWVQVSVLLLMFPLPIALVLIIVLVMRGNGRGADSGATRL